MCGVYTCMYGVSGVRWSHGSLILFIRICMRVLVRPGALCVLDHRQVSSPCRSLSSLLTLSFFVKSPHHVVLCQVSSPCRSLSSLLTLSFFVKSPHPVVLCQVSSPCRSLSSLFTLSFFVKSRQCLKMRVLGVDVKT